jgi:branched-subunit amino acid transport protein
MEVRAGILLIILGTALVTFIPRVLPLMILTRFELPEWATRWLSFVPISVMAALVGQELLMNDGEVALTTNTVEILAALPTFLVAIKTKSLLATVVVGILSLMALRFIFI